MMRKSKWLILCLILIGLSGARASTQYYAGFKVFHGVTMAPSLGVSSDLWLLQGFVLSNNGQFGGFPYSLNSSDSAVSDSSTGPISGKSFDSYADLQNYVDTGGPWTLSITQDSVASVYSVTPDFSGISQDMLVSAPPIVPQPGQVIHSLNPTFSWPDVDYSSGTLFAGGAVVTISPQLGNTYTAPYPLMPGLVYNFDLNLFGYSTSDLPGGVALVSGPDLNLLPMNFQYKFNSGTEFSVVPEPNVLWLLLAAAPLALRRRRLGSR